MKYKDFRYPSLEIPVLGDHMSNLTAVCSVEARNSNCFEHSCHFVIVSPLRLRSEIRLRLSDQALCQSWKSAVSFGLLRILKADLS
jgi:hypothetical protein